MPWALASSLLFVASPLLAADDPTPVEVAPIAGAPVIALDAPTWCDGAKIATEDASFSTSTYGTLARNADRWSMLRRMAEHSCRAPDLASRRAWSRAWRQTIANHTGADAATIDRLFEFVLAHDDDAIEEMKKEACSAIEVPPRTPKAGTRAVPGPERLLLHSRAVALGCQTNLLAKNPEIRIDHQLYWLDRGPEVTSELARAVWIVHALDFDVSYRPDDLGSHVLDRLGNYAMAVHDIAVLDPAKLRAEVSALGTNAYGQLASELVLARARLQGARYAALIRSMDPAVAKLAAAATDGYDAWVRTYRANESAMKRVLQLEDWIESGETDRIRPCHGEAHAAFVAYARPAAKKAKDLEAMKSALRDTFARAMLEASLVCAAYEGKAAIASGLYLWELNEGEHERGPRVASYHAMLDRYAELATADPRIVIPATKLKYTLDLPSQRWFYAAYMARANNQAGPQGPQDAQIKAISKVKGGVKLTFAKAHWVQPIFDCRPSTRINYISFSGKVHYYQDCKTIGREKKSGTLEPVVVPTSMSAGLRAGQFVTLLVEENKARSALPLAVYSNPKQQKILGRFGVITP